MAKSGKIGSIWTVADWGKAGTYQDYARVDQGEGPRAADPGAAVHHGRPVVVAQSPGLPHLEQEVEEGRRGVGDAEVRPRGVMKVVDLSLLSCLRPQR